MEPVRIRLWLDMNLPVSMKRLAEGRPGLEIVHIREHGMQQSGDREILMRARAGQFDGLITKDSDFVLLSAWLGHPPTIIWLRCGNASSAAVSQLFEQHLDFVLTLVQAGEPLVEIGSPLAE